MNKIDWVKKLSSRKFWAAIIAVITALLAVFKVDEMTTGQIVAVVSAVGALVAYIFAESYIDGKAVDTDDETELTDDEGTDGGAIINNYYGEEYMDYIKSDADEEETDETEIIMSEV